MSGTGKESALSFPSAKTLEKELARISRQKLFVKTWMSTVSILIVIAAISVLLSTLFFPVFRIYGESMEPTLKEGDIVLAVKTDNFVQGDIVAFYYNNKVLIKRVIAGPGDEVFVDASGRVFVNEVLLEESYIGDFSYGQSDLEYPYTVPDNRWFVMGDERETSLDSRMKTIGTIAQEQIVGKIIFRVWPLEQASGL